MTIFTFSCVDSDLFEGYYSIKNEEWCRNNVAEFSVDIPQAGKYYINLCLRHTTDYEMANLWCFIETRGVGNKLFKDTVNIKVAEPDGRWLGKGGAIKTLEQPVNAEMVELPQGRLKFRLEQGMRVDCLKGIKDIGIRIKQTKGVEK